MKLGKMLVAVGLVMAGVSCIATGRVPDEKYVASHLLVIHHIG